VLDLAAYATLAAPLFLIAYAVVGGVVPLVAGMALGALLLEAAAAGVVEGEARRAQPVDETAAVPGDRSEAAEVRRPTRRPRSGDRSGGRGQAAEPPAALLEAVAFDDEPLDEPLEAPPEDELPELPDSEPVPDEPPDPSAPLAPGFPEEPDPEDVEEDRESVR